MEKQKTELELLLKPEATSSNSKSPIIKMITLGVIAALILIAIGAAYLLGKNSNSSSQINTPTLSPVPNAIDIQTNDWNIFRLEEVGMEFKTPKNMVKSVEEEIQTSEDIPGAIGSVYCAHLKKSGLTFIPSAIAGGALVCSEEKDDLIVIGGASPDISVGRGGTYSDTQGFIEENGNFKIRFTTDNYFETNNEVKTKKIVNPNGVEILKVYGDKFEGPVIWPNENQIWVIINTNDETYRGISFVIDSTKFSEETLDQILSTFKYSD